jgi:predicted N-formylglutamate amidohydrolase
VTQSAFPSPGATDPAVLNDVLTEVIGDPASGLLLIADHASARVPEGIVLGVPEAAMSEHVAIDIGVDPLGRALCAALGCPGLLAAVSRLVIDLNREEDSPGLIPIASDGWAIPGNAALDAAGRQARIDRFFRPYHARLADRIARDRPRLIVSLHSFTPQLASAPDQLRPWEIGILYNRDDRAARLALPLLAAAGIVAGDNLPYSGQVLNATMNRHAEANGIPYLGIEVRQDLIADPAGIARWRDVLAPVIGRVLDEIGA